MPEEHRGPIPTAIIWLHCISLLTSISIVVLSVFDYGALSLYMNPLTGLLTMFFHVPLIILVYSKPDLKGMLSVEAVAFAYLLSLTWLGCFIVMVCVAYGSEGKVEIFGISEVFAAGVDVTQTMQFIATSLEFSLLGDIAIRGTYARRTVLDDDEEKLFTPRH